MSVTTKDLARICGVSRATINRALHDLDGISEQTKKRILDTAEELGYQPDLLARSLVKGKSMTIGVIVVDLRNQYFAEMINAMEKKAREYGYMLNITLHEQDRDTEEKLLQTLAGHRVDGIILAAVSPTKEFQHRLKKLNIPVVLIGCRATEGISSVGIDEYAAAKDAVAYIAEKAYDRAVFVVPPLDQKSPLYMQGHERRMEGFCDGAKEYGLTGTIIRDAAYHKKACEELQRAERTAFLCSGAKFAGDLIFYLGRFGQKAGRDYGIISFDKIDFFEYMDPVLTIVDNFIAETGETAVDILTDMIHGKSSVQNIDISHKIIEGETL